jgi:hypothetical protein
VPRCSVFFSGHWWLLGDPAWEPWPPESLVPSRAHPLKQLSAVEITGMDLLNTCQNRPNPRSTPGTTVS